MWQDLKSLFCKTIGHEFQSIFVVWCNNDNDVKGEMKSTKKNGNRSTKRIKNNLVVLQRSKKDLTYYEEVMTKYQISRFFVSLYRNDRLNNSLFLSLSLCTKRSILCGQGNSTQDEYKWCQAKIWRPRSWMK